MCVCVRACVRVCVQCVCVHVSSEHRFIMSPKTSDVTELTGARGQTTWTLNLNTADTHTLTAAAPHTQVTHTHTLSHTHTHRDTHTHTHTHTLTAAAPHTQVTHTLSLTHTHTLGIERAINTHTHTVWHMWFTGTLHRRNGFYTVQTVCAITLNQPYT